MARFIEVHDGLDRQAVLININTIDTVSVDIDLERGRAFINLNIGGINKGVPTMESYDMVKSKIERAIYSSDSKESTGDQNDYIEM